MTEIPEDRAVAEVGQGLVRNGVPLVLIVVPDTSHVAVSVGRQPIGRLIHSMGMTYAALDRLIALIADRQQIAREDLSAMVDAIRRKPPSKETLRHFDL